MVYLVGGRVVVGDKVLPLECSEDTFFGFREAISVLGSLFKPFLDLSVHFPRVHIRSFKAAHRGISVLTPPLSQS